MYAILLFMVGCVLYIADTFSKTNSAMGEAFNVYLIIVQLLWLGYIHVDVRKYINTISHALEEAKEKDVKGEPVQLETTADGQYQLRINLPEPRRTFPQHYGFTTGRHGGSLYLKIGAAVFCLGYLIHSGLNLGQKVLYIIDEDEAFDACTCTQDILMSVLQPIYAFYQLFFIFKYSNIIINRRKRLSRFALMHCISASLLFWVYTIIQETLQAIKSKKDASAESANVTAIPSFGATSAITGEEMDSEEEVDEAYGGEKQSSFWSNVNYGCGMTTHLTKMLNDTTPYLYPFSIEYNILIVGIWILLWENIGRMDRHTHLPSIEMTFEDSNTKGISSNLIIYVDCHSSNRGLFAGLLLTVSTVISIILFFIFTSNEETKWHGLQVNGYSELIIHFIMGIAAVLAYLAIRSLDIVKHKVSSVDDILLYICLPCIFLYAVFSLVPAFKDGKPLFVAVSIVQVIQAVIQTALICDGLRRCSNTSALNSKKPGRELITFMVVANVALWLLETFEIKSEEGNYYKYKFYGKEAWTLLSHMTLPLALFYRFHSSVCLVDIWKAGYEEESEH
ncbi:UNVERIFIED_CONTAM: hypothetical protein GTU68_047684 [Idotea baltica]|nr:hypothetical protein [Idotea baltica]